MDGGYGKISFAVQLVETVDEQNIPISGQFLYEGKSEVGSTKAEKRLDTKTPIRCVIRLVSSTESVQMIYLKSYTVTLLKSRLEH